MPSSHRPCMPPAAGPFGASCGKSIRPIRSVSPSATFHNTPSPSRSSRSARFPHTDMRTHERCSRRTAPRGHPLATGTWGVLWGSRAVSMPTHPLTTVDPGYVQGWGSAAAVAALRTLCVKIASIKGSSHAQPQVVHVLLQGRQTGKAALAAGRRRPRATASFWHAMIRVLRVHGQAV